MPSAFCRESDWCQWPSTSSLPSAHISGSDLSNYLLPEALPSPAPLTATRRIIRSILWHPTTPQLSSIVVCTGFPGSCSLYLWFIPPFPYCELFKAGVYFPHLWSLVFCSLPVLLWVGKGQLWVADQGHCNFIGWTSFFLELLPRIV